MDKLTESLLTSDIKSALKFISIVKWLKIFLAIIILFAYFKNMSWLNEILIFSVVFVLTVPLGFFGTFIQKSLNYNNQSTDDRLLLNANESNEHFTKIFSEIETLKEQVNEIKENT